MVLTASLRFAVSTPSKASLPVTAMVGRQFFLRAIRLANLAQLRQAARSRSGLFSKLGFKRSTMMSAWHANLREALLVTRVRPNREAGIEVVLHRIRPSSRSRA